MNIMHPFSLVFGKNIFLSNKKCSAFDKIKKKKKKENEGRLMK